GPPSYPGLVLVARALAEARGDSAAAVADARRGLAVAEESQPPAELGSTLLDVCDALTLAGKPAEAIPFCARSVFLLGVYYPGGHPNVARALGVFGLAYLAAGQPERARGPLARADAILAPRHGDLADRARFHDALARIH